jgi:hypothetical protein
MFVGHLAPAFVAKTIDREIPLWVLVFAALLLDLIWSGFVALGIERIAIEPGITAANPLDLRYVPFSHSLVAAGIWSLVAAMGYANFVQWGRVRGLALVVGGTVLAHWFLDLLVHRPDLPLMGTGMKVGLGLWAFPIPSLVLELGLFLGALWWMLRRGRLATRRLRIGLLVLAAVLLVVQVMAAFGPPPPSVTVVAVSGIAMPLVITATVYLLERSTGRGRVRS